MIPTDLQDTSYSGKDGSAYYINDLDIGNVAQVYTLLVQVTASQNLTTLVDTIVTYHRHSQWFWVSSFSSTGISNDEDHPRTGCLIGHRTLVGLI